MRGRLLVVSLLLVATVVGALGAGPVAAQSVTHIETNHALDSDAEREDYDRRGVAHAKIDVPRLTLTASKTMGECGVEKLWPADWSHDFLCLDYDEEISRELVIDIPRGYFGMHDTRLDPVNGDGPTLDVEPVTVDGEEYIRLTVDVSGPMTATYAFSETGAAMTYTRRTATRGFGNLTGVSEVESADAWEFIPEGSLAANGTYALEADEPDRVLVQYQEADGEWIQAGEGDDSRKDVYTIVQQGRVYVFADVGENETVPPVRYKLDPGAGDWVSNLVQEVSEAPGRIAKMLGGLF